MAKLIVISGDERQEFELAAFNTIGRHPDNTIQILDRIISKEHAQIQRAADGRFLLRDLRSLNGTFMRGERIADHYLSDGDEFTMGSTRIVFVDKPKADDVLQRVTIAPGLTESHIRGRIQANTGDFMPERQIADDKILRRDYERLRIGHELARAVGSELDLDKLLPEDPRQGVRAGRRRSRRDPADGRQGRAVSRASSRRAAGKSDPNIVLSKTVMAEVVNNKAAVLSSRRDDGLALLRRALDHHAGHPLDDDRCRCCTRASCSASCTSTRCSRRTRSPRRTCRSAPAWRRRPRSRSRTRGSRRRIEKEAQTRAQISRLIPPSRRRAGPQGRAHDREGRPVRRGDDAVLRHPRLHHDVGRPPAAGDRQHAERVLRGDGRHPVQVQRHARQVRRRRDHRPVRRADRDRRRAVQGGRVRARDAAGARGVQPHARRREPGRRSASASASTPAT